MTLEDLAQKIESLEARIKELQYPHLKDYRPFDREEYLEDALGRCMVTRDGKQAGIHHMNEESGYFHGWYEQGTLAIDTCWDQNGKNSKPDLDLFVRR